MPTRDFKFYSQSPSIAEMAQKDMFLDRRRDAARNILAIIALIIMLAIVARYVYVNSPSMENVKELEPTPKVKIADLRKLL